MNLDESVHWIYIIVAYIIVYWQRYYLVVHIRCIYSSGCVILCSKSCGIGASHYALPWDSCTFLLSSCWVYTCYIRSRYFNFNFFISSAIATLISNEDVLCIVVPVFVSSL